MSDIKLYQALLDHATVHGISPAGAAAMVHALAPEPVKTKPVPVAKLVVKSAPVVAQKVTPDCDHERRPVRHQPHFGGR